MRDKHRNKLGLLMPVLAILTALTTSFTPRTEMFEMWIFDQEFVPKPSSLNQSFWYDELQMYNFRAEPSFFGETIDSYMSSNFIECYPSEESICIVKVDNLFEQVTDFKEGSYF